MYQTRGILYQFFRHLPHMVATLITTTNAKGRLAGGLSG
jgi:hypothetical protein